MASAVFPAIQVAGSGQLSARFITTMGTMIVALEEQRAPNTVKNFVGLAMGTQEYVDPRTSKTVNGVPYYDGTIFHRVIADFMIQGGDPTGTGRGGPGYKFADEFHPELLHTVPGMLSMANSGPNSNGSQFFICEKATPWLDRKHAVFGRVVEGVELIPQITRVAKSAGDRPNIDIVLQKVEIFRQ